MAKQIVIFGNVGSGKSTLVKLMSNKLKYPVIDTDELYLKNPFFDGMLNTPKRWTCTSQIWFLNERVKYLESELQKYPNDQPVIVDSGLPMSYAYVIFSKNRGDINKDEWELYNQLFQELTHRLSPPTAIIYLKAPVSFIKDRVQKRGRPHELALYDEKYLTDLSNALDTAITTSNSVFRAPVITVDAAKFPSADKQLSIIRSQLSS